MTRFEEAALSEENMAITVSFCIAAYLEQLDICKFSEDELTDFMVDISEIIEKWLMEESEDKE